jgi:hypothetical protein
MQKYACNNCGNTFLMGSSAQNNCPACGSNSISEIGEASKKSIWQNKIVIISIASIIVMLIILFLLPRNPNHFDVSLERHEDSCYFKIIVKDGNRVLAPDKFRYSLDKGNWQKSDTFHIELSRTYSVNVKFWNDSPKKFTYRFQNPFVFNPECGDFVESSCDCKKLQITKVYSTEIGGRQAVIISAQPYNCPKEYSFTGKDYQKDSIVFPEGNSSFQIFIRSAKCEPIAYTLNPFVFTPKPVSGNKVSTIVLQKKLNDFINKPSFENSRDILSLFETNGVTVTYFVDNNSGTEKTISSYLDHLQVTGKQNGVIVLVNKIKYNTSNNKIKQLSVTEKEVIKK